MERIIEAACLHMKRNDTRLEFYILVINAFEDFDWDCVEECLGRDPVWDLALRELHPEWDLY